MGSKPQPNPSKSIPLTWIEARDKGRLREGLRILYATGAEAIRISHGVVNQSWSWWKSE